MAEETNCNGNMHHRSTQEGSNSSNSNLEGFIASQMERQESGQNDNLDTEKRDNFMARAIAESKRMNKEVEKSREKQNRFIGEFGEKMVTEWREEHAAEVLSPQQQELVSKSYQQQ